MSEAKDNLITKGFSGTIVKLLTFHQRARQDSRGQTAKAKFRTTSEKAIAIRAEFKTCITIKKAVTKALCKAAASPEQKCLQCGCCRCIQSIHIVIVLFSYFGCAKN